MSYDIKIDEQKIPVSKLRPNPWNHNEQTEFMQQKLGASLTKYGQVAEIIVRETIDGTFEIIDGEHRYKELLALGEAEALVNNLGVVPDDDARLLTAVMNELRGTRNPTKLSRLLNSLKESPEWGDITEVLPFTAIELENILEIASDVGKFTKKDDSDGEGEAPPVAWVDIKLSVHQDIIDEVKSMMLTAKKSLGVSAEPDEALENGKLLKILLGHGVAHESV